MLVPDDAQPEDGGGDGQHPEPRPTGPALARAPTGGATDEEMSGTGAGFGSTMVMGQYAAPELATVVGVVVPALDMDGDRSHPRVSGLIDPPFAPGVLDVAGGLAGLVVTDEPVQRHPLVGHLVRTPGSGDGRQSSDAA